MKILIILFILFFASCCNNEEGINSIETHCIQMDKNPEYITEDLNQDYTIQFPSDYKGEGLIIGESANFLKYSDNVQVKYSFLCPTDCIKFYGWALDNPIPNSVVVSTIDETTILDQKEEFCKNDIVEAIFYQNSEKLAFGTLFLKNKDQYLESANIQFKKEKTEEVISILMTLQKK
ncbi:MAG TPA: hypothetical protein PLC27_04100 [Saprospiraceae bacterium]|nr:hypothetical protein [Saprospiraceae bacterium]